MELYYLITISNRDCAEVLSGIYQAAGAGLILTKLGRGTATGEQLSSYGLDATEKAIISTVADPEQTQQIFRAAKRKLFIDIPGNGVMMAIPLKSVAGGRTLGFLTDSTQTGGKPAMDFSHELIMVIMNEGYSDTVMDAARSAGAGGGTVLHAKGTGKARAEKFFGVSFGKDAMLVPDGENHFTFTTEIVLSPVFYGWLAGFGEKAELLFPESVRESFAALCRRTLSQYEPSQI